MFCKGNKFSCGKSDESNVMHTKHFWEGSFSWEQYFIQEHILPTPRMFDLVKRKFNETKSSALLIWLIKQTCSTARNLWTTQVCWHRSFAQGMSSARVLPAACRHLQKTTARVACSWTACFRALKSNTVQKCWQRNDGNKILSTSLRKLWAMSCDMKLISCAFSISPRIQWILIYFVA